MSDSNWTVYVDDNFHYMNEDERYSLGAFDSYDAAAAACKKIVDAFLQGNPAKTSAELYDHYTSFGGHCQRKIGLRLMRVPVALIV
jgi:hypothetical protein